MSKSSEDEELSVPTQKYVLVLFDKDFSFDLVLNTWFKTASTVLWPPKRVYNKAIEGNVAPDENWTVHRVSVLGQRESWTSALKLRKRYDKRGEIESTDNEATRQRPHSDILRDTHSNFQDEESEESRHQSRSRHRSQFKERQEPPPKAPRMMDLMLSASVPDANPIGTASASVRGAQFSASTTSMSLLSTHTRIGNASSQSPMLTRSPVPMPSPCIGYSSSAAAAASSPAAANASVTVDDLYDESDLPGSTSAPPSSGDLAQVLSVLNRIDGSQRALYLKVCRVERRVESIERLLADPTTASHREANVQQSRIPTQKPILENLPLSRCDALVEWVRRVNENKRETDDAFTFFRRLGGKNVTVQVSRLLYQLVTDKLAMQYSLRGAARLGVAKKSFTDLGILPLVKNVVWSVHKAASAPEIEEAVGEHLRYAAVRMRRKAQRSLTNHNSTRDDNHDRPSGDGSDANNGENADNEDDDERVPFSL